MSAPADRHAIGIAFGNSNSGIALVQQEDKAEVIANEDGGLWNSKNDQFKIMLICLQIVKSQQFYRMLKEKNSQLHKQSRNLSATTRILSPTSEISWVKSKDDSSAMLFSAKSA